MSVFEIKHARKSFGDLEVLKDISVSVEQGEVIAILGPSGSGKSTFLRCATMLEELDVREACAKVRRCVETSLTPREANIIRLRYGLDDRQPLTQREIAVLCGISRSYVSRGA